MKLFSVITSIINRFDKGKKYFGWVIKALILINSFFMWASKKEYKEFKDCLFHYKKQSHHPYIGDRVIEYSWLHKQLADIKSKVVLDVGAKQGLPSTDMLLNNENHVYAIDLNVSSTRSEGNLTLLRDDIRSTSFKNDFFDAVVAISIIEHIGITGRYGISTEDEFGDMKAMKEIHRILIPGGLALITIPYGVGKSLPMNRLYTGLRVEALFKSFEIKQAQYFVFNSSYKLWLEVPESVAAQNNWDKEPWYALACFAAIKPE